MSVQASKSQSSHKLPPLKGSSRVSYGATKHSGECSVDDQFLLADAAYERGDSEGAFAKFLQLAEDGDLNGMSRVACMYGDGEGTRRSREKSLEWDSRAAALGSMTSMFNLGITYRNAGDSRVSGRPTTPWNNPL
jgi:TPR repeat protein